MLLGALKALTMIAPPAALLLPLDGSDFGQMMAGEGIAGDDLQAMVLAVFWIGAIGQGWVLLDWWRRGRERDGTAIALGVAVLVAHLGLSRPTVSNRKELALAKRAQVLPSDEQQALREERESILQLLQERQLVDAAGAKRARATPLGEWWILDRDATPQV